MDITKIFARMKNSSTELIKRMDELELKNSELKLWQN